MNYVLGFLTGLGIGMGVITMTIDCRPISLDRIEYLKKEVCAANGGIKTLYFNKVVCVNGAEFKE